jgi:iron(III) transport system substrate-binding protein
MLKSITYPMQRGPGAALMFAALAVCCAGSAMADGAPRAAAPGVLLAQAAAKPAPASLQADLEALIKGARAEGEVSFYTSATENVGKRIGDAFAAKYGVKYQFVRLPGAQVPLRYAAEAEAGNFSADLIFIAGSSVTFGEEAIRKGWMESIPSANLPAVRSGEFPARFITGPTAVVQIAPWYMAYNSQRVGAADAPRDWMELLKPQFKGQILIPDPRSSDSYLDLWGLLIDKYGEKFFAPFRAQNLRVISSGVPAVQALGAGEGMVGVPGVPALYAGIAAKGAPLVMVAMDFTTGVEMSVLLTARAKAKHPNAARLLAHFTMTAEGNKIFNSSPGDVSVFDTALLPKQYESPKPGVAKRQAEVLKALGIQ